MIMKKKAPIYVVLLIFSLVLVFSISCSTRSTFFGETALSGGSETSGIPSWYLDPETRYPDETYLAAAGSGETRKAAEKEALAGLSQRFETTVQVDLQTREYFSEIVTAQGLLTEEELELVNTTNIQSSGKLLNVQFSEATRDSSGSYYIIAFIERIPSGRIYLDLIQKNSKRIMMYMNQAEEAEKRGDVLDSYAFLNAAAILAAPQEALLEQLRIISPGMSAMASTGYNYTELLKRQSAAGEALTVSISINGDHQKRVRSLLAQVLNRENFAVLPPGDDSPEDLQNEETAPQQGDLQNEQTSSKQNVQQREEPVLQIQGDVSLIPTELNPDFKTVRWVLRIEVSRKNGNRILTFAEQGRSSGLNETAAVSLAYKDMQELLEEEFTAELHSYFSRKAAEK